MYIFECCSLLREEDGGFTRSLPHHQADHVKSHRANNVNVNVRSHSHRKSGPDIVAIIYTPVTVQRN